jgi:prepilin-type processing-associated H-X9-DG protein
MRPGSKLMVRGAVAAAFGLMASVGALFFVIRHEERSLATCQHNLAAISLALLNYQTSFESFPYGAIPNPELPPYKRLSWITAIFGHLEGGLQLKIDQSRAWDDAENRTPLFLHTSTTGDPPPYTTSALNVALLRCPAGEPPSTSRGAVATDYVGIAGLGRDAATLPLTHSRTGVFGYDRVSRPADITDGAGETMMVAEVGAPRGSWTAGGLSTLRGLDPKKPPYIGRDGQFGRKHRDGAMVAFADGSVRLVRRSIDPHIFESLSTIAGRENLPPDWDR